MVEATSARRQQHAAPRGTVVLLHGSGNGSQSFGPIAKEIAASGARVFAPDMLGYGDSPAPSAAWDIREEVLHLERAIDRQGIGELHLMAHSLGSMFALHLWRSLGARLTRLVLIDPVVVSVLREARAEIAYAEMEAQYQRFMQLIDPTSAARFFVEHWGGRGAWAALPERARAAVTALVPKLRREMLAARSDRTGAAAFAEAAPPTTILVGERTLVAPRTTGRVLAAAFAAQVVVVPGAGHMIPKTHASAVVDAALQGFD